MIKVINILIFFHLSLFLYGQESLMLGEIILDEIQPERDTNNVEQVVITKKKYRKKKNDQPGVKAGEISYSKSGLLLEKTIYTGKDFSDRYVKRYKYDGSGKVIQFDNMTIESGSINNKRAEFSYNAKGQVTEQVISLATISYNYFPDGRLKTKAYHYNNGGGTGNDPWTIYFIYDENKRLIHADNDSISTIQTSFYNASGQLVKHDYYPGVAYTTYAYDSLGNCTRQIDYLINKSNWDSTVFVFEYDDQGRIVKSMSSGKKGKLMIDQEWVYDKKGQIQYEIVYSKNKKKLIYEYSYEYYPFKE